MRTFGEREKEKGEKSSSKRGVVFNIQRYSIQDGPGIRTTIFLKGCPLKCLWCHNPEGINPNPEIIWLETRCLGCRRCVQSCHLETPIFPPAFDPRCNLCGECLRTCPAKALELAGRGFSKEELMEEILKDRVFFDLSQGGVTFSGGEPLFQGEFLLEILSACKEERIHTALDTSGFCEMGLLQKVEPLSDLFLYDIKTIDVKKHLEFTGVPNFQILENLSWLSKKPEKVIVRFPVIPGLNDDDFEIQQMGEFLLSLNIREIDLIPYHKMARDKYRRLRREYPLNNLENPSSERLEKIKIALERYVPKVKIGG
ncbi:MAG: glycyl-radical enzyme activating protein [Caldiserica bacterium]|nr:glycyl-radical enzyme activating protein [Caldisericota bacterium]MDH7562321.1 glycyl-radical enzyme activating protein [Caldisericota bacterium]